MVQKERKDTWFRRIQSKLWAYPITRFIYALLMFGFMYYALTWKRHGQNTGVPPVDVWKVKIPGNAAKSAGWAAIPEDGQAGGGFEDQPVSAGASASV